MLIQLHLKPTDTRGAKAYRLQVKERLYRFNYVSISDVVPRTSPDCLWVRRKYLLSSRRRSA